MKIGVITISKIPPLKNDFHTKMKNIAEYNILNKKNYCEKHDYHFKNIKNIKNKKPISWHKLIAIEKELPKYDWLLWIDADCFFMNMNIKLEDIIDQGINGTLDDCYIIVSKMESSNRRYKLKGTNKIIEFKSNLNLGVLLLKNTTYILEIIKELNRTGYSKQTILNRTWEQGAFEDYIRQNRSIEKHIHYIEDHKFNIIPSYYKEGDFIVHFLGDKNSIKKNISIFPNKKLTIPKKTQAFYAFMDSISLGNHSSNMFQVYKAWYIILFT
jgi:hypothetical protein